MEKLTAKPKPPQTKKATQKPRAKVGRKRSKTKAAKTPAGSGGVRLRDSVSKIVGEQADDIAIKLVEKAKAGNASLARMVVVMSGADKAPPEPPKKKTRSKASLFIHTLASEPEWTGPWEDEDGKRDASKLLPSEPDWPDDSK